MSSHLVPSRIWRKNLIPFVLTATAVLAVCIVAGQKAFAQAPVLKLRFGFDEAQGSGTSTASDTSGGGAAVSLLMLTTTNTPVDLHGAANSGVAGVTMNNRALDMSSTVYGIVNGGVGPSVSNSSAGLSLGAFTNFVVSQWFKWDTTPFGFGPPPNGPRFFLLGPTAAADVNAVNTIGIKYQSANQLYYHINNGNPTVPVTFTNLNPITPNKWFFQAMVRNGTNVYIYLGSDTDPATLVASGATPDVGTFLTNTTTKLIIGNRSDRARPFDGWIDDTRFYTGTGDLSFVEGIRQAAAGPASLTAAPGNAQVSLTWNSLSGATSYNVKRATSSGGPYTTITTAGTLTTTNYTDSSAANFTTYYYTVSAATSFGESANSVNEASATPTPPPDAPTGLSATPGNAQVALSWTASAGAASYRVKRATVSGGPYAVVGLPTGTSFTDATAVNTITYYYVVSGLNAFAAEGGDSTEASATPVGPPPAPAGLQGSSGAFGEISLGWNASVAATSYNVYRATTSGGAYTMISTPGAVTTTSFADNAAPGSAPYYYVVSAQNGNGEGPQSIEAAVTPLSARLRFDFEDTGTTTTSSPGGVVLNLVNSNNLPADFHGGSGTGVAGVGKTLDFTGNPYNSPVTGPLASTAASDPTLNFGVVNNFTLTFWIKPDSDFYNSPNIVSNNNPRPFVLAPASAVDYGANPGISMKINSYDTQPETGQLRLNLNGTEFTTATGSFLAPTQQWAFLAVTYDGATLRLYSASETRPANAGTNLIFSAAIAGRSMNFTNGTLLLGNITNLLKGIDGAFGDFRFYTGAGDSNLVENIRLLAANPPSGLAGIPGVSQVALSWNSVGSATSYNVKRATVSGGAYTTLTTPGAVTGTNFVDSTALAGTTYYYVVSGATPYGESVNSAEVSATPVCVPPPTAGNSGPICAGSILQLTASTVPGGAYGWTGPNGFVSSEQNPSITNATSAAAGVYSVAVTVGSCTSLPGMTTAVINDPPAAPTAGYNAPVYAGMQLNLSASLVADATYNWTGPNGFAATNQNPSIPVVGVGDSGTYSVTVTVGSCTSAPATTEVTVNPGLSLSVEAAADGLILNWPFGTLESATNVTGPWLPVSGATSPHTNSYSAPQEFFRVLLQ